MQEHLIEIITAVSGMTLTLVGIIYADIRKRLTENTELSRQIEKTINESSITLATIVEQISSINHRIRDHEDRIRYVEKEVTRYGKRD